MKLVIISQYRENYGEPDRPYWKYKGGDTYIVENIDLDMIQALAAEVTKDVEYNNDMATNEVINWWVMGDNEAYHDGIYDITTLEKVDGKWKRAKHEWLPDPVY